MWGLSHHRSVTSPEVRPASDSWLEETLCSAPTTTTCSSESRPQPRKTRLVRASYLYTLVLYVFSPGKPNMPQTTREFLAVQCLSQICFQDLPSFTST